MTNEENNKTKPNEKNPERAIMNVRDFAQLGDGQVAYIRRLNGGEAIRLFPTVTGIPEDIDLYALVSADGTPLTLRDNRNSAIADAIENDLEAVSVH
jgi:hypothetical protein